MVKINVNLDNVGDRSPVIEPGRYEARVIEIDEQESQSGNPMLVWTWEISSGENQGIELRSYTSLQEHALFGLKNHLEAFGISGEVDLDTDKLVGKKAIISVLKTKIRSNQTGDEIEVNRIQNVSPAGKSSPQATQQKGSKASPVKKGSVPL